MKKTTKISLSDTKNKLSRINWSALKRNRTKLTKNPADAKKRAADLLR